MIYLLKSKSYTLKYCWLLVRNKAFLLENVHASNIKSPFKIYISLRLQWLLTTFSKVLQFLSGTIWLIAHLKTSKQKNLVLYPRLHSKKFHTSYPYLYKSENYNYGNITFDIFWALAQKYEQNSIFNGCDPSKEQDWELLPFVKGNK